MLVRPRYFKGFGSSMLLCFLILALGACAPAWEIQIAANTTVHTVSGTDWQSWRRSFPDETNDDKGLALERVLWETAGSAIVALELDGRPLDWATVHNDSWLMPSGQVCVQGECAQPSSLHVVGLTGRDAPQISVSDLAPTIAGALKVRSPKLTSGRAIASYDAEHILLILIDGLGYSQYMAKRGEKITPFLDTLGVPLPMQSVYPSQGAAPLAAMLTGTTPQRNGITGPLLTKTSAETLLDVIQESDRSGLVIDGQTHRLDLPSTQQVSPDASSAKAAFMLAQQVVIESAPALLIVRIRDLEDATRDAGLDSDAQLAAIADIDQELARLVMSLPEQTLILITSSYGMHRVHGKEQASENGSLLPEDIIVPLWVVQL